jgi:hypothetical protein
MSTLLLSTAPAPVDKVVHNTKQQLDYKSGASTVQQIGLLETRLRDLSPLGSEWYHYSILSVRFLRV